LVLSALSIKRFSFQADAEGRDSLTPSPSPGATKRKADDLQEQDLTPPAKVEKKPEEREDNCKTGL